MDRRTVAALGGSWKALAVAAAAAVSLASGQEMQPRAYLPAPAGLGYAGIAYSHNSGGQLFDPSLPVTDTSVKAHIPSLSVGEAFRRSGARRRCWRFFPTRRLICADVCKEMKRSRAVRGWPTSP